MSLNIVYKYYFDKRIYLAYYKMKSYVECEAKSLKFVLFFEPLLFSLYTSSINFFNEKVIILYKHLKQKCND